MRLRRWPGRPVPPHMDEVYADLHCLTELVLLIAAEVYLARAGVEGFAIPPDAEKLVAHLNGRLAAQEKELEVGPPPES